MVKFRVPKFQPINEFLEAWPDFAEKGVVALFPNLIERDREEKKEWLQTILVEGQNGSTKATFEFIAFCTSGDAMITMKSAEAAKKLVSRSPLYKHGTEVIFESWSDNLKVRLQYRGAFNRIVDYEEVEY